MSFSINSVSSHNSVSRYEMNSQYRKAGIPDDIISQGETAIQNYAFENQITLPDFTSKDDEPLFEMKDDASENQAVQSQASQSPEAGGVKKKVSYNA